MKRTSERLFVRIPQVMTRCPRWEGPITIKFAMDLPWREAVAAGGPDTPSIWSIWDVGDEFKPEGKGIVERRIYLRNYPTVCLEEGNSSEDKAQAWAKQNRYKACSPRAVFALSKKYPLLPTLLGTSPTYVVSPQKAFFGAASLACYAWWGNYSTRMASLDWSTLFNSPETSPSVWYAFMES
ncbi:MAG TPA: hypothetical protein VJC02_00170 [Candidatus Paceibacterota bacterium]